MYLIYCKEHDITDTAPTMESAVSTAKLMIKDAMQEDNSTSCEVVILVPVQVIKGSVDVKFTSVEYTEKVDEGLDTEEPDWTDPKV